MLADLAIGDGLVREADGGRRPEAIQEIPDEGNRPYSDAEANTWFEVNEKRMGFDEWVKETGETGAKVEKIEHPDDTRCIEAYVKSLGLEASIDAFFAEIRKQSRTNWRGEFTAPVINAWMRAGSGMKKAEAKGPYPLPFVAENHGVV